jgi:hypothetical protein
MPSGADKISSPATGSGRAGWQQAQCLAGDGTLADEQPDGRRPKLDLDRLEAATRLERDDLAYQLAVALEKPPAVVRGQTEIPLPE